MQKNDDAYLLYFMKRDCKSNKSQSEKALTVSQLLFFFYPVNLIQGPSCHCLDMHYYVLTAYILI